MSMFQLQGFYIRDIIRNKIKLPSRDEMEKSFEQERVEEAKLVTDEDMIRFQVLHLVFSSRLKLFRRNMSICWLTVLARIIAIQQVIYNPNSYYHHTHVCFRYIH